MISIIVFVFMAITLDISSSSAVIELNDVDFESAIADYDTALVMFYAPWCGACKQLKPEFESAAVELAKSDPPVQLVKVDCTEGGKKTCESINVSGYPTLKVYKRGEAKDYQGPRKGPEIVKYMARQAGPSIIELNTKEAYDELLSGEENVVVGFFPASPSPLKRALVQTSTFLREKFRFASTSLPVLLKENDGKEGVVLFRPRYLHNKFEPSQLTYEGKPTPTGLETWLTASMHGLVDVRKEDNMDEFDNPLVVAYYNVDYTKNAKITNYWRNRILMIAKDYASDFTFAISSKDEFRNELEDEYGYKYTASDKPVVFAQNKDNKKFAMTTEFSPESFEEFLKKLRNNEVEPYLKSEPIPEDNSKHVKVAVAQNFDDIVINNNKDTLIEFYAPWCGHCKKLSPIWDELGEKMINEDVVIVKMDATANDVPPPFETKGFPTIYWAPKNGKASPIKYTGKRELTDFVKYIAEHATYELKTFGRDGKPRNKAPIKPSAHKGSSEIGELTDADFKDRISQYEHALVMFYAPWCGHCKKLKPEFEKASVELKKKDPPIQLFKVDCTKGGEKTCDSFDVSSYPTLKIFKNGELSGDYDGKRDNAGIVKHMTRISTPAFVELNSKEAYEKFLSGEDTCVVGFFIKDSSTLKKAFLDTAESLKFKFRFGIARKPELIAENGDKDGVVLFRPKYLHNIFEPSQLKYEGRGTKAALEFWLNENIHGLVDPITRYNVEEFQDPLVVAYYNVDYEKNAKVTNYWRNRIMMVAQFYRQDFSFAVSSIDEFKDELRDEFGYNNTFSEKPVVFARDQDKKKYVMTSEFSTDSFETFLNRLLKKKLEPYFKSEPIPDDNSKPVKVAVAKNFDEVVMNNNQDTLIEFYAPWCGHCKKLAPIWDELGEKMLDEDVTIVKMDATANDIPNTKFKVQGFPSIYWAPKNDKSSPIKYSGERELKEFIKYIAKHSTDGLKNYNKNGKRIKKLEKEEL